MQSTPSVNHNQPNLPTIPAFIQRNISLADKNWFQTGGAAQYFYEPTTNIEFAQALMWAQDAQIPTFILGQGANILISDTGFAGLVIRPKIQHITRQYLDDHYDLVECGAGIIFQSLIDWCIKEQLVGLEEFSGIPGTVGGSVFINIHYFEFLLSSFLVSAQVINKQGHVITVDHAWFEFGYNQSRLHQEDYYLVSATFKLKKVDAFAACYAQGRRDEIIRHRVKRYPNTHTCGSFFRNFYDHEVSLLSAGKKLIYVAYYLDKIGVKGQLSVGDAIVSYQHANMIVNKGKATTSDIIELVRMMQQLVYNQFGIIPQPECRLIGFDHYPLITLPI